MLLISLINTGCFELLSEAKLYLMQKQRYGFCTKQQFHVRYLSPDLDLNEKLIRKVLGFLIGQWA
jgi:hypothetical protein